MHSTGNKQFALKEKYFSIKCDRVLINEKLTDFSNDRQRSRKHRLEN